MTFTEEVFAYTKTIPKGETRTYKQVAEAIGRPHSARAVGNALNKNYDPSIPCHRVVRSDGRTGGYNRGVEKKEHILHQEKLEVSKKLVSDIVRR